MARKNDYRAPALEKGLAILELLSTTMYSISSQEIVDKLGFNSTQEIFRMLVILEEREYIYFERGGYILAPKLSHMVNQNSSLNRLLSYVQPYLEELCAETLQSCHISTIYNNKLVVVAQESPPYKMFFALRIGAELDLWGSGSGLVALSFLKEKEREDLLTKSNATDSERSYILEQIPRIRKDGYHCGPNSQTQGLNNISYPIFTVANKLYATITIPFLTFNSKSLHHQIQNIDSARKSLEKIAARCNEYLLIGSKLGTDNAAELD